MNSDDLKLFSRLSREPVAVVSYRCGSGTAYFINSPTLIGNVFQQPELFKPLEHPFRVILPSLSQEGQSLFRGCSNRIPAHDLEGKVRRKAREFLTLNFLENQRLTGSQTYQYIKLMVLSLCLNIIFDYNCRATSETLVSVTDTLEDIRCVYNTADLSTLPLSLRSSYLEASNKFSVISENIALQLRVAPNAYNLHAIRETLLNASVPLSYCVIWTILLLAKNKLGAVNATVHYAHENGTSSHFGIRRQTLFPLILEALRLYPPAWILGRQCAQDTLLGTYFVPEGSFLSISPYTVQRSTYFWDHPEEFVPARFERPTLINGAYFPFGGGERKCPAAGSAFNVIVPTVASFLEFYDFSIDALPTPQPLIALRPGTDFTMNLQRRFKFSTDSMADEAIS